MAALGLGPGFRISSRNLSPCAAFLRQISLQSTVSSRGCAPPSSPGPPAESGRQKCAPGEEVGSRISSRNLSPYCAAFLWQISRQSMAFSRGSLSSLTARPTCPEGGLREGGVEEGGGGGGGEGGVGELASHATTSSQSSPSSLAFSSAFHLSTFFLLCSAHL